MVEQPHALVLDRVFGEPLAQKPNLQVRYLFVQAPNDWQ